MVLAVFPGHSSCAGKVWRDSLGSGGSPKCHHPKEFNPPGQDPAARVQSHPSGWLWNVASNIGKTPHGREDPVEKFPRPHQCGKRKKTRNLFEVLHYLVLNPAIQFLWLEAAAPTQNVQGAAEGINLLKYPDASLLSHGLV